MAYTSSMYTTLASRGNVRGTATRPSGSDSYWPPVGTTVNWALSQPIQDLLDQGKQLGWGHLGTIGDTYHRQRHGDHTPWSAGKQRGVIYAKDTDDPSWLEDELVRLCQSDYDTAWIDFWNCNGSQYNYAGQRVAGSGDHHLHISVNEGHELRHVTLFLDLDRIHRGLDPVGNGDDVDLNDKVTLNQGYMDKFPDDPGVTDGSILVNTALGGGYIYPRENNDILHGLKSEVADLKADVAEVKAALASVQTPQVTDEQLAKLALLVSGYLRSLTFVAE